MSLSLILEIIFYCKTVLSFSVWNHFFPILCDCFSVLKAFMIIIDRIYCCFFVFYPIRSIYIWSTTFQIYFKTFARHIINSAINTSRWCFKSNLTSIKKWFKKSFNNFICFIINHDFYVITRWMRYTLFLSVF